MHKASNWNVMPNTHTHPLSIQIKPKVFLKLSKFWHCSAITLYKSTMLKSIWKQAVLFFICFIREQTRTMHLNFFKLKQSLQQAWHSAGSLQSKWWCIVLQSASLRYQASLCINLYYTHPCSWWLPSFDLAGNEQKLLFWLFETHCFQSLPS